ncbi:MAG: hypothetical protein QM781_06140 [Chitinophagaceae bacterium]
MLVLETDFIHTLQSIKPDPAHARSYWDEIVLQHSHKSRYYHSLTHLESVWAELQPVKAQDYSRRQ